MWSFFSPYVPTDVLIKGGGGGFLNRKVQLLIGSRLSSRIRPCVAPRSPAQLLPPQGAPTKGHRVLVFNDPAAARAPAQLLRVSTSRQYDASSHAP